jgi:thiol-disulfide isomerase/thioredoxin
MTRKTVLACVLSAELLAAVAGGLYVTNAAPAVPPLSADAAHSGKPYVVKLHAQWRPYCMITKGVWSQVEETYRDRVNLVVLDFTNDANWEASRVEAARLGLDAFFEEYAGATGIVVVLDGRTRQVTAEIGGSRDFADYRAAIDEALSVDAAAGL